jgi:hypothetical protein
VAGCANGVAPEPKSTLMDQTTAGENRCVVTKSHDRPFVIEWDATDLASFEAKAAHDVVFVRYEGCHLTVLDCSDAGLRGALGAYRAPEWTSGTVEGFDMQNQQELYANLPLGAAQLSGRLENGEALRLRYYVSGVAVATRDAVGKGDLPAKCADATHFVQSYNLGAFELATMAHTAVSAAAGFKGVGAGGSDAKQRSVLKRGGDLDTCTSESKRCQVPIRINLRTLEDGKTAKAAPPPAGSQGGGMDALLAAGKLRNEAQKKLQDGDAVACLADLDRAREIDPDPEHELFAGQIRAQCTMKIGKCEQGKDMLRDYFRKQWGKSADATAIDSIVKQQSSTYCAH